MKETKATDWKKLRLEYVNSSITYEALAKKYQLKPGTIRQRANRDNPKWEDERHELSRHVTLGAQMELLQKRSDELQKINEADINLANGIRNEILRMLKEAQDEKDPATKKIIKKGTRILAKDLRLLAAAAESAQRMSRLAIGAPTEQVANEHAGPGGGPMQSEVFLTDAQRQAADEIIDAYINGSHASTNKGSL